MKTLFLTGFVIALQLAPAARADDLAQGKRLSITCSACHGEKGLSQNPLWPNLAGQKKDYLQKQLTDFKSGKRQDLIMTPMAQTLTVQDIQDLSIYYSQL